MAAAGASNKIIAQREMNAHNAASGTASSPPPPKPAQPAMPTQPAMGFPTSYNVAKPDPTPAQPAMGFPASYNVAKAEAEKEVGYTAVEVPSGNTQKLQDAYNALKEASGDGKFGLKNISGNEASELASKLTEMRGILLNELN